MTNLTRITVFTLIICISGIASAQDTDKTKDRKKQREFSGKRMNSKQLFNKRVLGQLDLTDDQKKSIGKILRESQAAFRKMRQQATGNVQDPETASARKELIKQLKDEGKSRKEIRDAIREEFGVPERPKLDDEAKAELAKSMQAFRAKTTKQIKKILTDEQRVMLDELVENQRGKRGEQGQGKGKKKRGKDGSRKNKGDGFDD